MPTDETKQQQTTGDATTIDTLAQHNNTLHFSNYLKTFWEPFQNSCSGNSS